jgi:hypothetical protein
VLTTEFDQIDQFVVVNATNNDRVDLQAAKDGRGCRDAFFDAIELVETRQGAEPIVPQRVEADRQAVKPRLAKAARMIGSRTPLVVIARSRMAGRFASAPQARAGRAAGAARRR